MHLRKLSLMNYRNYQRCLLDLDPGATVFHGANGQGKTNLLEAVYLLATTKSPRAGGDRELVSWSELAEPPAFARVAASVARAEGEVHVDLLLRVESETENGNGSAAGLGKQIK